MKYIIDTDKLPCNNGQNCTSCPFWSIDDSCEIREQVKRLPKYEERHGEWIPGREISQMWTGNNLVGIDYEDFSCSCCGVVVEESTEPEWNFCPNCGADMRKEGNQK